jgi:hypothetical protein
MAKFVSKNSNYMVVLKPGLEGNRALGTQPIPGIYVKFQSGIVDIKDEKILEMMRSHPSNGGDFTEVKDSEVDPYVDSRQELEPDHYVSEIEYGHSKVAAKPTTKVSPELKKFIQAEAVKMIPGLLKENPSILKDIIKDLASAVASEKEEIKTTETKEEIEEIEEEEEEKEVKTPAPKTPKNK